LFVAALLLLNGCRENNQPQPVVVARVDDQVLTEDEVAAWETTLLQSRVAPEVRAAFIRRWVESTLLAQVARDRGLDDDPWVQTRLDETNRQLLTSRLVELESSQLPNPTASELEQYFTEHQGEFVWQRLHLTVSYWRSTSRAPLDRLRRDLSGSRPQPLQPQEAAQVDSGHFEIDNPASVEPVAWKLFGWMKAGQVGYPSTYRGGWWLFRIARRDEPGSKQALTDVQDDIRSRLFERARTRRQADLVRDLSAEYQRAGRLDWPMFQTGHDTITSVIHE